jgi:predicted ribosomally synthesized peptide with nif11-like leader
MSQQAVKEFFKRVAADESLLARLKEAEHLPAIVAFAAAEGARFSVEDLAAVNPPYRRDSVGDSRLAPPSPDTMACSQGGCNYTSYAVKCVTSKPIKQTAEG